MGFVRAAADYAWPRSPLAVAFDDQCGLCQRFRRLVAPLLLSPERTALDSAQRPANPRLRAIDGDQLLQTLHAAAPDRIYRGFAAVSALARRTLLGLPLLPAIAVLEFTTLGEGLYTQVNRRRRNCGGGCAASG